MKQGSNQRRSRGRGNGGRRTNRNQTFESNGPDVKVRGTAQQVLDKYLQLARDSQSGGDRVKAEAYLQFAEHYYRIVNVDQDHDQNKGDKQASAEQGDGENDRNAERQDRQDRQERKPRGRRPRQQQPQPQPQKNEATLAAEAAAANEEAQKDEKASAPAEAEVEVLNTVEDNAEAQDEAANA